MATIGPASDNPQTLKAMAAAGMDVARLPLAHGSVEDAIDRLKLIKTILPDVATLADLPGPKIRSGPFPEGGSVIVPGARVELVTDQGSDTSSEQRIAVCHQDLVPQLQPGDRVALGDGGVWLTVEEQLGDRAIAVARSGGRLQGRPGVTDTAGRATLITPTPEDLRRLAAILEVGVDCVAVSFVRSAADMHTVRQAAGPDPMLCAKIETPEGIADLDNILDASDVVMVARGDLGVRVPIEDVPHVQKQITKAGIRSGCPVITATQMLESMVTAPVPTRAEVTDIANAVLDGTSAVMLSAETAIGVDPANAVATMAAVAWRAEQDFDYANWGVELGAQDVADEPSERITAAITAAAWRAAKEERAAAIIACTRSGLTARHIARFRPSMPILGSTPSDLTMRKLRMSWGVDPLKVPESVSTDEIVWHSVEAAVQQGYVGPGDVVVVLAGSPTEPEPLTDTIRLVRIH